MGTYKHLSINERELIYLYNSMNFSVRRIAKFLERHPSTISRELRRHTKRRYYSPSFSQQKYESNRKKCGRPSLLANSDLGRWILFISNVFFLILFKFVVALSFF